MLVQKASYTNTNCIDTVKRLCKELIEESPYNLTYNPTKTYTAILQRLADEETAIFVVPDERDYTGGFIICQLDNSWHNENFGYIEKFYVGKDSRGTPVARALFMEATKWFDRHKCVQSFLTDTAGTHQDKRLVNLVAKFRYYPVGATLMRSLNE